MVATVRVQIDRKAVGQFLKSDDVARITAEAGRRIQRQAGEGFEVQTSIGRTRARTAVIAVTYEARVAEARDRRLTRAIGAGRG